MNGYEAYKIYLGVNTHFERDSYDFFKYKGGVSATETSYRTRRDRHFFERVAMKLPQDKFIDHLVAIITAKEKKAWIGDVMSPEGNEIYLAWAKRIESISYIMDADMRRMKDDNPDFDYHFKVGTGMPNIYTLYLKKQVCLESIMVINALTNVANRWKNTDTVLISDFITMIRKYSPFFNASVPETAKYKTLIREIFS